MDAEKKLQVFKYSIQQNIYIQKKRHIGDKKHKRKLKL